MANRKQNVSWAPRRLPKSHGLRTRGVVALWESHAEAPPLCQFHSVVSCGGGFASDFELHLIRQACLRYPRRGCEPGRATLLARHTQSQKSRCLSRKVTSHPSDTLTGEHLSCAGCGLPFFSVRLHAGSGWKLAPDPQVLAHFFVLCKRRCKKSKARTLWGDPNSLQS